MSSSGILNKIQDDIQLEYENLFTFIELFKFKEV